MKLAMKLAFPLAVIALAACETTGEVVTAGAASASAPPFEAATATRQPETLMLNVQGGFAEADARLRAALEKRPMKIVAVIDHSANASGAGLSLEPTKVYIFGNPRGGTPFMAADPRMGLQLPLRMAIYQRGGETYVLWPDIEAIARSHGIEDGEAPVSGVKGNLRKIAEEVAFGPAGEN